MEPNPVEPECPHMDDAGAYVLGELDDDHRASFTEHLKSCLICAHEVEVLESAADAVPLLASRPMLKPEFAASERRRGNMKPEPAADTDGDGDPAGPVAPPEPSERPEPIPQRPRLQAIQGGAAVIATKPKPSVRRRVMGRGPISRPVMAAFLLVAVVGVVTVVLTRQSNAIHYYRASIGWTGGGAVIEVDGSDGHLLLEGMPFPALGKRYEIWVLNRGTIAPAPTGAYISLNLLGEADVRIPGDIGNAVAVAVYVEPDRGPQTTKSGPVVAGYLRSLNGTTNPG